MHYTPQFIAAHNEVLRIAKSEGPEAAKVAFRDAMIQLGHDQRIINLYRVQDKLSQKAVFFQPNKLQQAYLKDRTSKNIILKCRQVGFTTLNCLRALDLVIWESNMKTGILCHKLNLVETIFTDITKFAYDWFKRDWGNFYAPTEKTSSGNSLSFKDDGLGRLLNSSIRVMFDFRGKTVNFLHISEGAFVNNNRLTGSLNSVPDNGEVTIESTANGMGGDFYRFWQMYKKLGKSSPYKGHFFAWWQHYPEQSEQYTPDKDEKYSIYEQELMDAYPEQITPAHILWRRYCVPAKCEDNPEIFEQEYPTNDEDCFTAGQSKVFAGSILKAQKKNICDPSQTGFLIQDNKRVILQEDPKGVTAIWEKPQPSHTYVIGADPAGSVGKDMAAAYVKNQKTKKIVARIWGDLLPEDFANLIYKLALYYNHAWLCVEANNHGNTVIYRLKQLQYPNLYRRQEIDPITSKLTRRIGFYTTNDSKLMVTEAMKNACRHNNFKITDQALIVEMSNFIQSTKGRGIKREAFGSEHDDLVMAACFTEEMDRVRSMQNYSSEDSVEHSFTIDPDTGFPLYG